MIRKIFKEYIVKGPDFFFRICKNADIEDIFSPKEVSREKEKK